MMLRAGSLLSALGLDSSSLISKMKDRNGNDPEVKRKAEEELTEICDRYLRVLAVNIGTDIDRLVMQSSPGHFLWGKNMMTRQVLTLIGKQAILFA